MEGPEFSVDAIITGGKLTICGLADRHIFFPPYFIEMGHTMPADVPKDAIDAILAAFTAGVRSLGLAGENCWGAAKGDVKLTASGPMIGEIAARLSGGYMSGWTYPYSSGAEPAKAAIFAALGKVYPGLTPVRSWTSAERAFISIPGKVRSIRGLETARSMDHIKDVFLRVEQGGRVRFPENNVSKCGNIIAAAPDRAEAAVAAESAARSVLIRLEAPNTETAAFLAASSEFPPDAFTLNTELRAALEKLPAALPAREMEPSGSAAQPIAIFPFPAFTTSGLRDYTNRTIEESLEAVRLITGLPLPIKEVSTAGEGTRLLGRRFWTAFIRGGYQGAAYFVDNLANSE
jgi:hypothetical protein